MDVICERCSTEYEFDDALVSERGTTVKCTTCSHQFKVRRADAAGQVESWVVRTVDGRTLEFTALRDLQAAITRRTITREDVLAKGSARPRRLGSITELEPFFADAGPASDGAAGRVATASVPPPVPKTISVPPAVAPPFHSNSSPPPKPSDPPAPSQPSARATAAGLGPWPRAATVASEPDAAAPTPSANLRGSLYTPMPPSTAASHFDDLAEPRFSAPTSRRAGSSRMVVGVVLAGAIVFLGVSVGRRLLGTGSSSSGGALDPRVVTMLSDADRSLAGGDLDSASEQLAKASVLADSDGRVYSALARLAAIRADQKWLRTRVLPAGDSDETEAKRDFDAALAKLSDTIAKALELAPSDVVAVRARIDALRMKGDRDGARKLVPTLGGAMDTESAYTLAALDVIEAKPLYGAVIERLRAAATIEQNLGRARSTLVYALAKSGDLVGAKTELAKLSAGSRTSPLAKPLVAFVARLEKEAGGVPSLAAGPDGDVPDDPRECMKLAAQAQKKGNLKRAEQLFAAVLVKNPDDPDAMSGLGDVARASKDTARASKYYEQALAKKPDHLPSLVALADMRWDGGDRPGAVELYKKLLAQPNSGPYATRARSRITGKAPAGHDSDGAVPYDYVAPQAGGDVDKSDLHTGKGPKSGSPPPGVDTSDLTGHK